ncbi:MAG: hypothetical protein O9972_30240, partial [Burkholderiales bacterium]|nr:hypothetical protein [Burkholderiales bacterium]
VTVGLDPFNDHVHQKVLVVFGGAIMSIPRDKQLMPPPRSSCPGFAWAATTLLEPLGNCGRPGQAQP